MLWSKVERNTSGHVGTEPVSARAQEIARSHEEMLGLLRGLPESEYELSFTDLVERSTTTTPAAVDDEGERGLAVVKAAAEEASAGQDVEKVKERKVMIRRTSSERRTNGGGGGGRDGVLLNVYVPSSLTRSLTECRSKRGPSCKRVQADCNKRDRQRLVFGCWSAIWERGGRGKPRRH